MILLDTDHLSHLTMPESSGHAPLLARMQEAVGEEFVTSIVNAEEIMRGWLAVISRERKVKRQINAYARLGRLFDFFADWTVLPFDDRAATEFERLWSAGARIGSMDLKIASIALVHDALLLTANRRDFEKVPGLRFENWLGE